MEKVREFHPWFGLEQEYTLMQNNWPLGWPQGGYPNLHGRYYCSVGAEFIFGRKIVEHHYRACLHAGIRVGGTNSEGMPGQWEFQVGPSEGIQIGDDLWMARYILLRVAELYGVSVSFHPKPMPGEWSGSGLHANFSTFAMREPGGLAEIKKAIEKLSHKHMQHMSLYGANNQERLTGKEETSHYDVFTWGCGDRNSSVRINRKTEKDGKGWLEDRRPGANADPYVVIAILVKTICLDS